MRFLLLFKLVWLLSLVTACATTPRDTRDTSAIESVQKALAEIEQPPTAVPPDSQVDEALMPSLLGDEQASDDERFDLTVDSLDARQFFMGLVKDSAYNMVVHPDVEGVISLELRAVTVAEVMQVVNEVYGYPFKKRGNLYQVMPGGLRTEVFQIDYLSLKRKGLSETQVTNGEVSSVGSSSTGDRNSNVNNRSSRNSNNGSGSTASVGAQVITETESDFWKELQQTLEVLVGQGEDRSVVVTPQAGMVVVRAMPSEIETAREFLSRAELIMRRQVVLEAKILEVQLSEGYQTGIDWTAVGSSSGNRFSFDINAGPLSSPDNIGGVFSAAYSGDDFSGVINLLENQGSVQVLSSPRISTVNNQKAVIKVGQDEFFVTEISNTTTTSTGTTTNNPEVELTPFFSGIALDVTPQISEQDEIILHIHPSISEVEDQTKVITLGNQNVELPLALSTIRETDSIVFARSGQVVVLGGLMQDKSEDVNSGAPIAGKLPVVGHLFGQQRNRVVKNELVILLKPIIMGPNGSAELTQRSSQRFKQFRKVLDKQYRKKHLTADD